MASPMKRGGKGGKTAPSAFAFTGHGNTLGVIIRNEYVRSIHR